MGLVHLYIGDGKGKTTAAVGLAVRAAGCGCRVIFVQFLKGADTGEQRALRQVQGMTVLENPQTVPFVFRMKEAEKQQLATACMARLQQAWTLAEQADLLILDEGLTAVELGMLPESAILECLPKKSDRLELVLTGRHATAALQAHGDYITRMEAIAHPFDRGIPARRGIEY